MGKTKKLVIAAVATVAGAAGAGVLLHKSANRTKAGKTGTGIYRGSHTSKTLHQTGCRYYDSKKLTRVFKDLQEALAAGYRSCKICI
jgi:hypothetical protein